MIYTFRGSRKGGGYDIIQLSTGNYTKYLNIKTRVKAEELVCFLNHTAKIKPIAQPPAGTVIVQVKKPHHLRKPIPADKLLELKKELSISKRSLRGDMIREFASKFNVHHGTVRGRLNEITLC